MIRFIGLFCILLALLISIQPQHTVVEDTDLRHFSMLASQKVNVGLDPVVEDNQNMYKLLPEKSVSPLSQVIAGKTIPESLTNSQDFNCLAQAVYFEARGEPLEGQLAVAQVVLNRVKSKRYPNKVCAVVFQNEKLRHRCQFSFACDGKSDRPRHMASWRKAQRISLVAVEGLWQDLSLEATHYHANYVSPDWSASIKPIAQYGAHYFYKGIR